MLARPGGERLADAAARRDPRRGATHATTAAARSGPPPPARPLTGKMRVARHREAGDAHRRKGQRLQRPARGLAADRQRHAGLPACGHQLLQQFQHRRGERVVTVRPAPGVPRSAANRNCIRSLVPTETKSASASRPGNWNSSEGTSIIVPTSISPGPGGRARPRPPASRARRGIPRRSPPSGT